MQSLDIPFLKTSMQETRFVDLNPKLNYPYLYAHAGGCEHILYIKKIRNKMDNDTEGVKCVDRGRTVLPSCDMCELNTPIKFTWNDMYAPKYPCFWCLTCFEEFHFDGDGNAVYDFDSASIRIEF
jgi:snRNA-activating protein complex subunit 3